MHVTINDKTFVITAQKQGEDTIYDVQDASRKTSYGTRKTKDAAVELCEEIAGVRKNA